MSNYKSNKKNYGYQTPLLKLNNLQKTVNKVRKTKKYFITVPATGEKFVIFVDQNFLESKKQNVINNTLNFVFSELFKKVNDENVIHSIFAINMLCEFTSITEDNNLYSIESRILAMSNLKDLGIFEEMLGWIPTEQFTEVYTELEKKMVDMVEEAEKLPAYLEEALEGDLTPEMRKQVETALKTLREDG